METVRSNPNGRLDVEALPCDAVMASSNKCFEGVPGMGYAVIRRSVLEGCAGYAHSLASDENSL